MEINDPMFSGFVEVVDHSTKREPNKVHIDSSAADSKATEVSNSTIQLAQNAIETNGIITDSAIMVNDSCNLLSGKDSVVTVIVEKQTSASDSPQPVTYSCKLIPSSNSWFSKPYGCQKCNLLRFGPLNCMEHLRTVHLQKTLLACKPCQRIFSSYKSLLCHQLECHCDRDNPALTLIESDLETLQYDQPKIATASKMFCCYFCAMFFSALTTLVEHYEHAQHEPVPCESCNVYFVSDCDKNIHDYYHKKFSTKENKNTEIVKVEKTHKNNKSKSCMRAFPDEGRPCTNTHTQEMRKRHVPHNRRKPEQIFKLEKCIDNGNESGARFLTVSFNVKKTEKENPKPLDRYKCKDCNTSYYLPNYENHIANKFLCEICGYQCCLPKAPRHMAIYHTQKGKSHPFLCVDCRKTFRTKMFLVSHYRRVHLKELNFECEVCKKKFFAKEMIKKHMTLHTKKFKHRCEICNTGFTDKYNMQQHMKNTHRYSCTLCHNIFTSIQKVKDHCSVDHSTREVEKCREDGINLYEKFTDFQCGVCYKFLASKQSLGFHIQTHQGKVNNKNCWRGKKESDSSYNKKIALLSQKTYVPTSKYCLK